MDKNYVYRLMRAKCEYGSLENYLNVDVDHGVLALEEQEPLLNANDHTNKNVIHFGNCSSPDNTEMKFRKGMMTVLGGVTGFIMGEILEDVGIMATKCKPQTPIPWILGHKSNCLDGAPALTLQSELACKNGGAITLVPLDEYPDDDTENPPPNEDLENIPPPDTVVQDGINSALNEAFDKVLLTGEIDENTRKSVESALMLSSALPPPLPSSALLSSALLAATPTVLNSGSSATYNATKLLEPNMEVDIIQMASQLEPYSVLNNKIGEIPTGIAHNLNKQGYGTSVSSDTKNITKNAQNADASILLYATTKSMNYVTFEPNGEITEDSSDQKFTFYVQSESQIYDIKTMNEFNKSLETDTLLGVVAIAINQKK